MFWLAVGMPEQARSQYQLFSRRHRPSSHCQVRYSGHSYKQLWGLYLVHPVQFHTVPLVGAVQQRAHAGQRVQSAGLAAVQVE